MLKCKHSDDTTHEEINSCIIVHFSTSEKSGLFSRKIQNKKNKSKIGGIESFKKLLFTLRFCSATMKGENK